MEAEQQKFTLLNQLDEVKKIAQIVQILAEKYKLDPIVAYRLDVSLDELITNIISYGYPDGGQHEIHIEVSPKHQPQASPESQALLEPQASQESDDKQNSFELLEIKLIDQGVAFDPTTLLKPNTDLSIDERSIGGLGIHFVHTFMNEVRYERQGNKNVLILILKLNKNLT